VPFAIFNLYQQRFTERIAYARELLKQGKFDFTTDESYQYDREKAEWAKSDAEVKDLWRKRVKNDWLRLKLAGKDDKAIRETLDKRYEGYLSPSRKLTNEDVFQIFMNAYAMSIEPHTNYLGRARPRTSTSPCACRWKASAACCSARRLHRGARSGARQPGRPVRQDQGGRPHRRRGQGRQAPMTEVLGWRLDDVVALIRGPKTRPSSWKSSRPTAAPTASTSSSRWCARRSAWKSSRPRSRS
jgi:carboxyl-terminal processing protease